MPEVNIEESIKSALDASKESFSILTNIVADLSLAIECPGSDVYILKKRIGEKLVKDLISEFGGRKLILCTSDEYNMAQLAGMTYIYHYVRKFNWDEIAEAFKGYGILEHTHYERISLGKAAARINKEIAIKRDEILETVMIYGEQA